jgi:ankyrin repeat protein
LNLPSLGVLLRLDDNTGAEDIPLVRYAGDHWYQHAQIGNVELHIKDAMDHFFDMDKPHFSAWIRIQGPYSQLRHSLSEKTFPSAPLYLAAYYGLRGLVDRLMAKNPQHVDCWGGRAGTPLHASVLGGHLDVAQLLFAHGADINSRSEDNQTPLHIASRMGHPEVGKWLLNHGADVNSRAKDGRTPLHYVSDNTHLEAARILLECNAEVNARDDDGFTPFLRASESGNPDVLRLLLDHNADEHVRNNNGNTALHCAARDGHLEVAQDITWARRGG